MVDTNRNLPNLLITGTPGVGKSLTSRLLSERSGLTWLEVSKLALEKQCVEEYDQTYRCPVLDEDKLLDEMETLMAEGGKIVDYHGADLFPERWFDIVFVLRTDNTTLHDRLTGRGYEGKKLEDNIECEIFQIILEEAKSSYETEIVHELQSDTPEQVVDNVDRMCRWIRQWMKDNQKD